jgi:hypothetical protein
MSSALPFLQRDRSFIVVWSGEDQVSMEVFGEKVHIPPTDEVADFGQKGSIYRFPPAKDEMGRPIPGTVLISDKWVRDIDTMEDKKLFDAEAFLKHLHLKNAALLNRGLTAVVGVEDVEPAREAGKPKWLTAKVKEWEETIRQELQRQELWAKKGQPAPESSSAKSVREAIVGLKAHHRKVGTSFSKDELLDALAGPAVNTPFATAPAEEDGDVDISKVAKDLYKAAKEAGVFLKKEEIEGLFNEDTDAIDAVAEKVNAAKATV